MPQLLPDQQGKSDADEVCLGWPVSCTMAGRMSRGVDVVVLGGGVAGLAAARACHDANARVVILEARDRIGGRILTERDRDSSRPIELGAEFVHGQARELQVHLAAAGLRVVDVAGRHWRSTAHGLRPENHFWSKLQRVMRHLSEDMRPDRSFARFLEGRPGGGRAAEARRLAAHFVEGFQAADLRRVSARSLAGEGSPSGDPEAQRLGRIVDGYGAFIDAFAKPVSRLVRTRCVVTRVRWSRGRVTVDARTGAGRRASFSARAAIVTLPLGILMLRPGSRGHVGFEPVPGRLSAALAGLAVGHAMRVTLQCREPFWEKSRRSAAAREEWLATLGFLHAPGESFPVWWTQYPERTPWLVAWAAGPRAPALGALSPTALRRQVVGTLARISGLPARAIGRQIANIWRHDWDTDPFARGAYSYAIVGGAAAPALLQRPVDDTLFFAGEATVSDGRIGTVDGALASGERAARQVLRVL